ncbi:MAG: hypothetical protein IKY07_06965 [Clostridia bacterium]|nr:hypothetical protein [Clostridia bacterium]
MPRKCDNSVNPAANEKGTWDHISSIIPVTPPSHSFLSHYTDSANITAPATAPSIM